VINRSRENSVNNLQRIYTVVISLAIAESLRRLFADFATSSVLPDLISVIAVTSLLITIIPFYHGANRYLDARYVEAKHHGPSWSLMLDFVVIFVEGLIFFILSLLIHNRAFFFTLLSILFIIDTLWVGLASSQVDNDSDKKPSYLPWAILNFTAAIIIYLTIWSNLFRVETAGNYFLGIVVVTRTIVDYISVWSFYYPPVEGDQYIMPIPRPAPPPQRKTTRKRKLK